MEERKRKNIIIFTLCGLLTIMGIGYALLTSNLTIGATGTINSSFKIVMTEVTPSSACPASLTGNQDACGIAVSGVKDQNNAGTYIYNQRVV